MDNFTQNVENDKKKAVEDGFEFTMDWFHFGIKEDVKRCVELNKDEKLNILEIGVFEGKASVWFMENYMKNKETKITFIDPFLETDTTTDVTKRTEELFKNNLNNAAIRYQIGEDRIKVYKEKSENVLPYLIITKEEYDIIFVDGSHLSRDIIIDITLSWKMLKKGGYIILDDYQNKNSEVKKCMDFFTSCIEKGEYKLLHDRYQAIFKKCNI
jgi:hypothetical protein